MKTAVITLAHGRHAHLRRQQEMLARSRVAPDLYVVMAMDDPELMNWQPAVGPLPLVVEVGAGAHGLPLAKARNVGAERAIRAGAQLLIFLDVDCLPDPSLIGWYQRAAGSAAGCSSLLCGPVAYLPPAPPGGYALASLSEHPPHPARPAPAPGHLVTGGETSLFWSLSFAVTLETWQRTGGFCTEYEGYGGEDTDFAQAAAERGQGLVWVGGAVAYHQHHPSTIPPVQHVDDILRNGALFAHRWGWWPMQGWLEAFVEQKMIVFDRALGAYVRTRAEKDKEPSR